MLRKKTTGWHWRPRRGRALLSHRGKKPLPRAVLRGPVWAIGGLAAIAATAGSVTQGVLQQTPFSGAG